MATKSGRAPLRGVLKRKEFVMIGFAMLGNTLAYMTMLLFLPTYLLEEREMTLTSIGLIVGLIPLGGVCATFSVGFISDKIGLRKPTMWPPALIQPFLYLSLLLPVPQWMLPILTFTTGFMAWAPNPAVRSIPYELPGLKPSEVAVGQSLIQTLTMLGVVIGAPLVGSIAEASGSLRNGLYIVCASPLLMAILGFIIPETGPKGRRKER